MSDAPTGIYSAIEFFSGIGAFSEAARQSGVIRIGAAYDQNEAANETYRQNFFLRPRSRNLDTIRATEIPPADIWWMSPPCTPFSVRGKQRDDLDPRAHCFLNLIELIGVCVPQFILVENVAAFAGSRVHGLLIRKLQEQAYFVVEYNLCSSQFGVPMLRPRHFVIAAKQPVMRSEKPSHCGVQKLSNFLQRQTSPDLIVNEEVLRRYGSGFDIVEVSRSETPDSDRLTCFTRGYFRCRNASGSLVRYPGPEVRFVAPEEILLLLGYSEQFAFPEQLNLPTRWRLVGNSVDVRCINYLLRTIMNIVAA